MSRESDFPATSIGRPSRLNETQGHPLLSSPPPTYVPYTPRHRPTPTSTVTGTTVHPPPSPQHAPGADATSKLQMMHLKAAAQGVGLDTGTMGWAILERVVGAEDDLLDVWAALAHKATLLLPSEPATSEKPTAEVVKDHVVLFEGSQMVTLSGLWGTVDGDALVFRSTVPKATLQLPPLPPATSGYPTFTLGEYTSSLSLPPKPAPAPKPPLPPRPGATTTRSTPRLPIPFASFFGSSPKTLNPPSSPSPSTRSIESIEPPTIPLDVSAFTLDRRIVRRKVGKGMNKALSEELERALASLPSWVLEKTLEVVEAWFPFIKSGDAWVVNPFFDEVSDTVQDLYFRLEEEGCQEMDIIEAAICSLLYDRFFSPSATDDSSHDETLNSRIVSLNQLDLSLTHLGIHVPAEVNMTELEEVIKSCGDHLARLDACRTPAEKAALIVAAHKAVVDGLGRLPPIRLEEEEAPPTARPRPEQEDPPISPLPIPTSESFNYDPPPPPKPTQVSGDVLLPMIIFSVVKTNPARLVSNLLFTQRFRRTSVGGEEAYCLINLMAVCEFLENVDMAALGLTVSEPTVKPLAPLSPARLQFPTTVLGTPSLRGRVEQGVDAIADSANKVISGVVDSSFGILKSLGRAATTPSSAKPPSLGRKESGFSIAGLAVSLPIPSRSRSGSAVAPEEGRQLVSVGPSSNALSDDESGSEDEGGDGDASGDESEGHGADTRSIKSFGSMLSESRKRKSLSDRLASSVKGKSPIPSRRASLLQPEAIKVDDYEDDTTAPSVPVLKLAPPRKRFMECTPDDLKLSEVGELLRDYRRLVEGISAAGGFAE